MSEIEILAMDGNIMADGKNLDLDLPKENYPF